MTRIAYVATGRTGDNPRQHELVEIALIERTPGHAERVSHWRLRPHRMPDADPAHLAATGYLDRALPSHEAVAVDATLGTAQPVDPALLALDLQQRLFGAVAVSLDPARDLTFLSGWLQQHGALPGWRRSVDMTAAAAGLLRGITQGWHAAARAVGRPLGPPPVEAAALDGLPWDVYRIARDLGVISGVLGESADAPARARLAASLWGALNASPPVVAMPERPEPEPERAEPEQQPEPEPEPGPGLPPAAEARPAGEHPYGADRLVAPPRRPGDAAEYDPLDPAGVFTA